MSEIERYLKFFYSDYENAESEIEELGILEHYAKLFELSNPEKEAEKAANLKKYRKDEKREMLFIGFAIGFLIQFGMIIIAKYWGCL